MGQSLFLSLVQLVYILPNCYDCLSLNACLSIFPSPLSVGPPFLLKKGFLHISNITTVGSKITLPQPRDGKSKRASSSSCFLYWKSQKTLIGLGLGHGTSLEPITLAGGTQYSEKPGLDHPSASVVSNPIRITWVEQQGSSCPEEGNDTGQTRWKSTILLKMQWRINCVPDL